MNYEKESYPTKMTKILPRLIRFKDAPYYLGMDRNRFNKEVRPYLAEIPIGSQGISFDRLDLDAWVEDYKSRSGRPAVANLGSMELWDAKYRQASSKEARSGTLKKGSLDIDFEKALGLSRLPKQKGILIDGSRK